MKKGLRIVLLILVIISAFGLCSCDLFNPNRLVGTWSYTLSTTVMGITISTSIDYTFKSDKSMSVSSSVTGTPATVVSGTYTYTPDTVTISMNSATSVYDYTISGKTLTLKNDSGSMTLTKK